MNILGSVPQFAENATFAKRPKEPGTVPFEWPWASGPEGLCVVGGDLSVTNLYNAYAHGTFPWPHEGLPLLWFSPDERGVIPLDKLVLPTSFKKWLKKNPYQLSWNQGFDDVIDGCKTQKRPGQKGSWITDEIVDGYKEFHRAGYAHSIECWLEGELVGGLYGVFVEGSFSAESMFHTKPEASKLCLWHLTNVLHEQKFEFLDIQMVTEITARFGGVLWERHYFLEQLQKVQRHFRAHSRTNRS